MKTYITNQYGCIPDKIISSRQKRLDGIIASVEWNDMAIVQFI